MMAWWLGTIPEKTSLNKADRSNSLVRRSKISSNCSVSQLYPILNSLDNLREKPAKQALGTIHTLGFAKVADEDERLSPGTNEQLDDR